MFIKFFVIFKIKQEGRIITLSQKIRRGDIKVLPLSQRENKITVADIKYLDCEVCFENEEINLLAQKVFNAYRNKKQVILMMGAHPLRRGNSRFIIDLMEREIITHIA